MYYCANAACPAQAQLRIEHFASRGAMDIRGIGESMSATLFQKGLVKNAADLYYLTQGTTRGTGEDGRKKRLEHHQRD